MKVILVDDERLALLRLEKMLEEIGDCEVAGTFLNPIQALEHIGTLQPEVVFLDIHMPGMHGLEAIEHIRDIVPDAEIVLVSAHEEYALKAFGLDVLDYVLKPINKSRLTSTIQRLRKRLSSKPEPSAQQEAIFCCMGMMQMWKPDGMPETIKWRTSKNQELFAYLLHQRNKRVSMDTLLELLWPELDEQKGKINMHTSIYQLRRIIKDSFNHTSVSIRYLNSGYLLETGQLLIDCVEWEQQLRQLPQLSLTQVVLHQQLFNQYRGDYFGEENYSWAESERSRIRTLWEQHAQQLGQFYSEHEMYSEAISVYYRMQQIDPLLETSYIALMNLFARLNDAESVNVQYNLAVNTMHEAAGTSPGPNIIACYNSLMPAEPSSLS